MGFTNKQLMREMLAAHGGNLDAVVQQLLMP